VEFIRRVISNIAGVSVLNSAARETSVYYCRTGKLKKEIPAESFLMKTPTVRTFLTMYAVLILSTAPALAHHSFGVEYDAQARVTLQGVITKVEWTNPHIYFYIDVKDANGTVVNWAVEGYPPNSLKRAGFMRDDLKIGDSVTVTAYRAKDSTFRVYGREVTFPDGSKKFVGSAQ